MQNKRALQLSLSTPCSPTVHAVDATAAAGNSSNQGIKRGTSAQGACCCSSRGTHDETGREREAAAVASASVAADEQNQAKYPPEFALNSKGSRIYFKGYYWSEGDEDEGE